MAFPANILTLAHAAATNFLSAWYGGSVAHSDGDNLIIDDLVAVETKLGLGAGSPSRGNALIGTATGSAWDRHARKNLLVNGSGLIKQRATLPTVDNAYAQDHWRFLLETAAAFTVAQELSDLPAGANAALRLNVAATGSKAGYWQPILLADMRGAAGGVVSLQAKIKASHARLANTRMGVMYWTGTADSIAADPINGGGSWGTDGTNPTLTSGWTFTSTPVSLAVTTSHVTYRLENQAVPSNAVDLAVFIWVDSETGQAADYLLISDVQLELGAVCTEVERLSRAEMMPDCTYWLEEWGSSSEELAIKGDIVVATPGQMQGGMRWLPKRTTPAISFSNFAHFNLGSPSTSSALTALSFSPQAPGSGYFAATTASTHTLGYGGRLLANTASARIAISAEP